MLHIDTSLGRAQERTASFLAIVVITVTTLLMTTGTTQWLSGELRDNRKVRPPGGASGLATSTYKALPMALTIPCAIAQTQQTRVAKLKRHPKVASVRRRFNGLNGARGLIAGLAIVQGARRGWR